MTGLNWDQGDGVTSASGSNAITIPSAGTHTHTITVNSTGSSTAHNNQQPYIVAYIWRRTA